MWSQRKVYDIEKITRQNQKVKMAKCKKNKQAANKNFSHAYTF